MLGGGRARPTLFLAAALAAGMCAGANAQSAYHAAPLAIELGDWALTPIVQDSAGGPQVHSFLALNQGAAYGSSLQAVWYIKDATAECSWYARTWETTDAWDAIKTVKTELGIPDSDDLNWAITVGPSPGSEPKPTYDYSKGFVADDGLGRAINSVPDRDQWVQWLVAIGYKAADVKFEKDVESADPAYPSTVLGQYARAAEQLLAQSSQPPPPPGPERRPPPRIQCLRTR